MRRVLSRRKTHREEVGGLRLFIPDSASKIAVIVIIDLAPAAIWRCNGDTTAKARRRGARLALMAARQGNGSVFDKHSSWLKLTPTRKRLPRN